MFEAWSAAPDRAKLFNVLYIVLLLLPFTACCVAFGAELFRTQSKDPLSNGQLPTYRFFTSHAESDLGSHSFADLNKGDPSGANYCTDAGRAFIAFYSLAFILLLPALALAALRIASVPLYWLPHPRHSLLLELGCSCVAVPLQLVGLAVYGGVCYSHFYNDSGYTNTVATGYAFVIVSFFALIGAVVTAIGIRRQEACWLGIGGDGLYGRTRGAGAGGRGGTEYKEDLSGFGASDSSSGGTIAADEEDRKQQPTISSSSSSSTTAAAASVESEDSRKSSKSRGVPKPKARNYDPQQYATYSYQNVDS